MNNTFTQAFMREGFNDEELTIPCTDCRGRGDKSCFLCHGLGVIAKNALEADPQPEPIKSRVKSSYTGHDMDYTGY